RLLAGRVLDIDAPRQGRADDRMELAFDEAGQEELAVELDHARGRAGIVGHRARLADIDDGAVADRHRPGPGLARVGGEDRTVAEHEVGFVGAAPYRV